MTQYGIFTKAGDTKIRAMVADNEMEARRIAHALTECAASNPRNRSPVHWVEKL